MIDHPIQILLVEDHDAYVLLLESEWSDSAFGAFAMTRVESLKEALAHLAAQRFDVVLLDLGLTDSDGLATLESLHKQNVDRLPVVVLTGHGDVAMGIRAVQEGAADYLVKTGPRDSMRAMRYAIERKRVNDAHLRTELQVAMVVDGAHRRAGEEAAKIRGSHVMRLANAKLTPREKTLLKLVVAGMPSKHIAASLQISIGTVGKHRARLMAKTKALNAADLARMSVLAGIGLDE